MPLTYDTAVRMSRLAWIGVAAGAVLALGAPLLPAPRVEPVNLTIPEPEAPQQPETTVQREDSPLSEVVWIDLEALMRTIHAVERPEEGEEGETDPEIAQGPDDDADEPQDREQQGLPGWRYVGAVRLGGSAFYAVLSIEQQQRFVREGQEVNGFTLLEVTPEFVVAQGVNGRFRIEREAPSAPTLNAAAAGMRAPDADEAQSLRQRRLRSPEQDGGQR